MKYLTALLLLLFSSCLLMPLGAPHNHEYRSLDNYGTQRVSVFCTRGLKTFIFYEDQGHDIEMCSDMFLDDCVKMEYKDFFEKKAFLKEVRVKDRRFHDLFKRDTLTIRIGLSGKALKLVPVIK